MYNIEYEGKPCLTILEMQTEGTWIKIPELSLPFYLLPTIHTCLNRMYYKSWMKSMCDKFGNRKSVWVWMKTQI